MKSLKLVDRETSSLRLSATPYLTGFQAIAPRFRTEQRRLLQWLAEAHARFGGPDRSAMDALFERYGASAEHIARRGHELEDFRHHRWEAMRLFGPKRSDVAEKTRFFYERSQGVFQTLYPVETPAPPAIVHVTCTGYSAPSGAQKIVSERGWGRQTEVLHAYHMGCYAAHPAIRIAAGFGGADVVHTELCSLHLDPSRHEPADLVIQSLFADGFIKYQVRPGSAAAGSGGFDVLAARDQILHDSAGAMAWSTGPMHFTMGLSKEVPVLLASALPRCIASLFEAAGLHGATEKPRALFAIHPGGPRIIDLAQKILGLTARQVAASRDVLREHGNMSSATLPHIWQRILNDNAVPDGTTVVSIGAGPGLTISGMILRKRLYDVIPRGR